MSLFINRNTFKPASMADRSAIREKYYRKYVAQHERLLVDYIKKLHESCKQLRNMTTKDIILNIVVDDILRLEQFLCAKDRDTDNSDTDSDDAVVEKANVAKAKDKAKKSSKIEDSAEMIKLFDAFKKMMLATSKETSDETAEEAVEEAVDGSVEGAVEEEEEDAVEKPKIITVDLGGKKGQNKKKGKK